MTIYSEDGSERTIDMRMKMEGEIWGELIGATGASLVVPSVEEEEELKVVVEERVKSEGDRIRNEKEKAKRAEDKRLLEQARQAVS